MTCLAPVGTYKIRGIQQPFVAANHYRLENQVGDNVIGFLDERSCFNTHVKTLKEDPVPDETIAVFRTTIGDANHPGTLDYQIVNELFMRDHRPLGKIAYAFYFQANNLAGLNPTTGPNHYTICHVPIEGSELPGQMMMLRPYWHLRNDDNPDFPNLNRDFRWCYGAGTSIEELYGLCGWCNPAYMNPPEHWPKGTVVLSLD